VGAFPTANHRPLKGEGNTKNGNHVSRSGHCLRRAAAGIAILSLIGVFLLRGAPAQSDRPVIVLVSVDTLRADHLRSYGYWRETSPFIDKLAGEGTVFDECVVPLPATGPSHASLLTSRRPWKHGLVANGLSMLEGVDTLAAALKRAGYYTAGVVAVPHIGANYGFGHGFDSFVAPVPPHEGDDIRSDSGAVNASVRAAVDRYLARRRGEPLFLFVHYFDCHFPYRWWDPKDPDKAIVWAPEETAKQQKQLLRYDGGIRHVDAAIQELNGYLSRKGLARNMVFVVTADHGEQIGDHGLPVGHADIYRETVHVPLIMSGPGLPHRHVSEVVSNMDVGVTLTRMAGARLAGGYDGVDLQPAIDRAAPWGLGLLAGPVPTRQLTVIGTPTYRSGSSRTSTITTRMHGS
jgi:arylsulfatase A-like enzyme